MKSINLKGNPYFPVHERIKEFHKLYKNGKIETSYEHQDALWIVRTVVTPDIEKPGRCFTGHAQEIEGSSFVNKTSALENAETSSVGRALGMLGIGIDTAFASADEIVKAENREKTLGVKRLLVKTPFSKKDEIKMFDGAKWEKEKKCWSVPDTTEHREMLSSFSDTVVSDEQGNVLDLQKEQTKKLENVTYEPPPF